MESMLLTNCSNIITEAKTKAESSKGMLNLITSSPLLLSRGLTKVMSDKEESNKVFGISR